MTGKRVAGIALIIIVVIVSELALRRWRRTMAQRRYLREHGTATSGTITDTRRVKNSKSAPVMLYAKIAYTVNGATHTIANTWPLTEQLRLTRGVGIDVIYDPAQPTNACVADSAAPPTDRYGKSVRTFEIGAVVILAIITVLAGL